MANKNLMRPCGSFAITLCMLGAAAPATAGETYGQISARLGVPMRDSSRSNYWRPSGDVSGQVGYPLDIDGPRFDCPSGWTSSMTVDSGTLPPGMTLQGNGHITGTPTERGHWAVVMKLENIMCDGHHFALNGSPDVFINYGIQQGFLKDGWTTCTEGSVGYCNLTTIRFHITGTGEVH
jgi:putative Ig domain-containing protein